MANTEVEHQWEQQEHDELEEDLIARRKNLNQTPLSTTVNGNFRSNNGGSVGEDQEQETNLYNQTPVSTTINGDFNFSSNNGTNGEDQEQEVKDFSQPHDVKVKEENKKQETLEYCVYYDTDKGVWKCRICSWDYQDPKRMNAKTIDQQRPCIFHEPKGTGLNRKSSKVEENGVDSTFHGKISMKDNINITRHNQENGNGLQNGEHQKNFDRSHSSNINTKTESSDIEVIKDGDDEITEFDVETVIKKQDTHDLFCPNCNSCITKRVILRKRKRRIPDSDELAKRNKPETSNSSEVNVVSDDAQPLTSNEYGHENDRDVFRCLSCFSIFMPTGNGFKLFRMFGNKSNQENNQQPSKKEVAVKKNWFSNVFASNKVEQLNNQGSSMPEANSHTTNVNMDLKNDELQSTTPSVNGDDSAQGSNTIKQPIAQESDNAVRESNGSLRPEATNVNIDLEKNQVQSATPSVNGDDSAQGSHTSKQSIAQESDNPVRESNERDSPLADTQDQLLTSYHAESNGQSDYPGMFVVKPPLNNVEPEEDLISPLQHDGITIHVPPNVGSLIIDNSKMNQVLDVTVQTNTPEKETIIAIPETPGTTGTPPVQQVESRSHVVEQGGGAAATGGRTLDIVKSIVYGGLLESIASLSVVASAAGADAATLNVLALGLANIFGGLFVISHDLWDLKSECRRGTSHEDRYQEFLGRRADFPLHMVVSLLSYLVFGFLPPVVYGFSFRESNDRDLKLLMVAAASIVCIMILAAGKAYVQRPQKSYFKTIAYYVVFGLVVSGVSYFVGELIMKSLEKLDIFPFDPVVNTSVGMKPALIATY